MCPLSSYVGPSILLYPPILSSSFPPSNYFSCNLLIHPLISISIHLHVHVYLSIHLYIYSLIHSFIHSFIHPSIHLLIYSSIHLSIHLSIHVSISHSVHLSIQLSIHPFIYMCLFACRVAVSRSCDVPYFGPPIPESGTFQKSEKFRNFLLTKCKMIQIMINFCKHGVLLNHFWIMALFLSLFSQWSMLVMLLCKVKSYILWLPGHVNNTSVICVKRVVPLSL